MHIIAVKDKDYYKEDCYKLFVADPENKTLSYCGCLPQNVDITDYKKSNPNTVFSATYPEGYVID